MLFAHKTKNDGDGIFLQNHMNSFQGITRKNLSLHKSAFITRLIWRSTQLKLQRIPQNQQIHFAIIRLLINKKIIENIYEYVQTLAF